MLARRQYFPDSLSLLVYRYMFLLSLKQVYHFKSVSFYIIFTTIINTKVSRKRLSYVIPVKISPLIISLITIFTLLSHFFDWSIYSLKVLLNDLKTSQEAYFSPYVVITFCNEIFMFLKIIK